MHRSPHQHARNTRRREASPGPHVADEAVHDVPPPRQRTSDPHSVRRYPSRRCRHRRRLQHGHLGNSRRRHRHGRSGDGRTPDRHGRSAHHDRRNHDGRSNNLSRSAHEPPPPSTGATPAPISRPTGLVDTFAVVGGGRCARPLCWLRGHDRDPDRRVRREW